MILLGIAFLAGLITAISPCILPVLPILLGGGASGRRPFGIILGLVGSFSVFTVAGGQATFKQLFSVYVHSTVITAAAQLFLGPLNYFRQSMSSATNLGILGIADEASYVGRLLGMIDLFWIWWLFALSIGVIAVASIAARPAVLAPIARVFGTVTVR